MLSSLHYLSYLKVDRCFDQFLQHRFNILLRIELIIMLLKIQQTSHLNICVHTVTAQCVINSLCEDLIDSLFQYYMDSQSCLTKSRVECLDFFEPSSIHHQRWTRLLHFQENHPLFSITWTFNFRFVNDKINPRWKF